MFVLVKPKLLGFFPLKMGISIVLNLYAVAKSNFEIAQPLKVGV